MKKRIKPETYIYRLNEIDLFVRLFILEIAYGHTLDQDSISIHQIKNEFTKYHVFRNIDHDQLLRTIKRVIDYYFSEYTHSNVISVKTIRHYFTNNYNKSIFSNGKSISERDYSMFRDYHYNKIPLHQIGKSYGVSEKNAFFYIETIRK